MLEDFDDKTVKSESEIIYFTKKNQIILAKNVKLYRSKKKWTQRRLCIESGISRPVISRIEDARGSKIMSSLETLFRIAAVFEIEPSKLLNEGN